MVAAENELFSAARAARDAGASWAGIGAAALLTSQHSAQPNQAASVTRTAEMEPNKNENTPVAPAGPESRAL
jgi:hypothetical protein